MALNDNKIDYIHWDNPNELMDCLRLLDASRRASNNAYNNDSVEELRKADLIIN